MVSGRGVSPDLGEVAGELGEGVLGGVAVSVGEWRRRLRFRWSTT
jgi:hypothetical protein